MDGQRGKYLVRWYPLCSTTYHILWSRSLCPADELTIGDRINCHGVLEESVEQEATSSRTPSVETERVFIEVVVHMLLAHSPLGGFQVASVSAEKPPGGHVASVGALVRHAGS